MIAPDAEVVDFDPEQWAWLSAAVVAARQARRWAYVLHISGRVTSTVPHLRDVPVGATIDDPHALAARVLATESMMRVVVVDRDCLCTLVASATRHWRPGGALTDYREAVHDDYWSSEAVVTVPAPPPNPWRVFRLVAEDIGTGTAVFAVSSDGGVLRVAIRLEIVGGVVRRISSDPAQPGDRLLLVEEEEFRAALSSDDVAGQLVRAWTRRELVSGGASR